MKISIRPRILMAAAAVSVLAMGLVTTQRPDTLPVCASPPLALTISPSRSSSVVHYEGMWIHVVVKNISDHTIGMRHTDPDLDYNAIILDSAGASPPLTERGFSLNKRIIRSQFVLNRVVNLEIPPGGTDSDEISIENLYNLKPGSYTIQVQRELPKEFCIVKSNTITVTASDKIGN